MKRLTNSDKEIPTLSNNAEYWLQAYFKLKDYEDLEEQGLLLKLPCKVGDAVYWMHDGVITECYINRVQINRYGVFIHIKSKKDKVPHGAFNAKINIGKTVFLTREEAEAALKGGEC